MAGQRADAREPEHDLRAVDHDLGEDMPDQVEEVVDLFFRAHHGLAHVVLEVGRPDEHPTLERVDEHDAAVGVLEEQLATARRRQQLGVVEHDVRPLRAAHEPAGVAECFVGQVGPGARGVDDDGCREPVLPRHIAQHDRAVVGADGRRVVRGACAVSTAVVTGHAPVAQPVAQDVTGETLGVAQRGIPVCRRVLHARVEARQLLQRALAAVERVPRNRVARHARAEQPAAA